jgi:hypothetical protein
MLTAILPFHGYSNSTDPFRPTAQHMKNRVNGSTYILPFTTYILPKPKPHGPKGLLHEIFKNCIRIGRDIRLLNISACSVCNEIRSAYAQCVIKFGPCMLSMDVHVKNLFTFYRWLSMRENSFLVCSVCDEIVS